MKIVAVTLALFVVVSIKADDFDVWSAASPDKSFLAAERRIPDADMVHRLDLDGFRLVIFAEDKVYARREFPLRLVSQIQWSPNSQFLLFTTASSGGHSPWHFNTFVFCVNDKTFRDVEDVTGGSVLAPKLDFEPPDIAVLTVHDTTAPETDAEMPSKYVRISLGPMFHKMKRLR
jgi:hypothetical protein